MSDSFSKWFSSYPCKDAYSADDVLAAYQSALSSSEVLALVAAATNAAKWMEELRASGDSGFWGWHKGDEYNVLIDALKPFTGGNDDK